MWPSLAVHYSGSTQRGSRHWGSCDLVLPTSCAVLSTLNFGEIKKPDPNPAFGKLTTAREKNRPI